MRTWVVVLLVTLAALTGWTNAAAAEVVVDGERYDAFGVLLTADDGPFVTVGPVRASGDGSVAGVLLDVGVNGEITLTGAVRVQATGSGSRASGVAGVIGSNSRLNVRGDVTAGDGDVAEAAGLAVRSDGSGAGVTLEGRVRAAADAEAVGVHLSGAGTLLENYGTVEASATKAVGLSLSGSDGATVRNFGRIAVAEGRAVDGEDAVQTVFENYGTVSGDIVLGSKDDRLVLLPTSRVEGDIDLGDGDDEAAIHFGSVLTGLLDGGGGENVLRLHGPAAGALSSRTAPTALAPRNFGEAFVNGGMWSFASETELDAARQVGGIVVVDESVAVGTYLLQGGELTGTGTLAGALGNTGGVVRPGSSSGGSEFGASLGIFTVAGDYAQTAGGTLEIEVGAEFPEPGLNHDQLAVTGTASFADGSIVRIVSLPGVYRDVTKYSIVVADRLVADAAEFSVDFDRLFLRASLAGGSLADDEGGDDGDTGGHPTFAEPDVYEAVALAAAAPETAGVFVVSPVVAEPDENNVLELTLTSVAFESAARTDNQTAVAAALTKAKNLPGTDLDELYTWLYSLPTAGAGAARAAFDGLSGEVYSHQPSMMARQLESVAATGFAALHEGRTTGAGKGVLWARGYHDAGRIGSGPGKAGADARFTGAVVGVDFAAGETARLGIAVGGGTGGLTMPDRASTLSGTGYQLGLYGRFDVGSATVAALFGYGTTSYDSSRKIAFGSAARQAAARFDATGSVFSVEALFDASESDGLALQPFASLTHISTERPAFREQGAGTTGLVVDAGRDRITRARAGLRSELIREPRDNGGPIPYASVAYVHDFISPERAMQARLQGAEGTPFAVHGTAAAGSGFELGLGATTSAREDVVWRFDYKGEFRASETNHRVQAEVRFAF